MCFSVRKLIEAADQYRRRLCFPNCARLRRKLAHRQRRPLEFTLSPGLFLLSSIYARLRFRHVELNQVPVDRGGSHIKFLVMQWSQQHVQISRCLCPSLVCSGSLPSAIQLRWL
ncbi:hypothetical protein JOB18_044017 [Solea senegalensis]|uniref:Uncharacterized protein n=1 Tax=Solea senegalensis TaxID=28829 RepID=A0AAV6REC0_SOLSE|nr:hypothetical protein JOB18_044017 [Solea senegalensis]